MPLTALRDAVRRVVPWWAGRELSRPGKYLWAIALHADALVDACAEGVKIRFPLFYSAETLPVIGRQRRIRRGPNESDEVYGTRLHRWWDDHKRRGGPYAMLAQIRAYFDPVAFRVQLVYRSGRRYTMPIDGEIVRDDIVWEPDNVPEKWARWWLFYDWPTAVLEDGLWDEPGTWNDGGVWDSGLTPAEVADLRAVPREWNAAHPYGTIVLFAPNTGELWDFPVGTWDEPGGIWTAVATAKLEIGVSDGS